jgi:hypothetical protein
MGNGALPHGPSYRAHPRLYLSRLEPMRWHVRSWRKLTLHPWRRSVHRAADRTFEGASVAAGYRDRYYYAGCTEHLIQLDKLVWTSERDVISYFRCNRSAVQSL